MSLRTTFNYIGRKLLYLWLKTEVIPKKIEQLDINPDLPVIYVLETRSWTNLLVLEEQCKRLGLEAPLANIAIPELHTWHSVYTIAPREPFKAWLQNQPKRSRMLRGIIETLNDYPEQEIQFIPVQIFWGRPVATQKHWLQVLFSDSWVSPAEPEPFSGFYSMGATPLSNIQKSSVIAATKQVVALMIK